MVQTINLAFERRFYASVETVWVCLTRSDLIARWFFAVDFQAVVGHRFRILGTAQTGWRGWTEVEVLEVEAPRRMAWRFDCTDSAPASRVEFALDEIDGEVRLRLTQHGSAPKETIHLLDKGWETYLCRLENVVAECQRNQWSEADDLPSKTTKSGIDLGR